MTKLKAKKGDKVRIIEGADITESALRVGDIVEIEYVGVCFDGWVDASNYYIKDVTFDSGSSFYLYAKEFAVVERAEPELPFPEVEALPTREQQIRKAAAELGDLLARKNADYGNSFAEQYAEYGMLSALIRLDDKMRRLKTLRTADEAQVKDEAIADSLLDMAGYALLAYVEEASK